jgi:4-hydroxymandelate synthase
MVQQKALIHRLEDSPVAARDIEYVELYVSDKQEAVEHLVFSLGFTRMAESADSGKSSTLLRQGEVQLVVTAGPATEEFLDAHGDGVADIAFSCDDVGTTSDAVIAAGGAVLDWMRDTVAVSGFGAVHHTLLPAATACPGNRLPPGRRWSPIPDRPARPAGPITGLDHIATCFEPGSLADYTEYYRAGLGLDWYSSEFVEVADQAMDSVVVRSRSGGITFTMLEPDTSRSPGQLDSFLDRNNGGGVQHLAFLVDDIVSAVGEFRCQGVEFLHTPDAYYDMLSTRCPDMREEITELRAADVLADCDEWGYLLQLFTRSPYERNTLFYELIQRRGARGFGSANIRALYEAVERDRVAAGSSPVSA